MSARYAQRAAALAASLRGREATDDEREEEHRDAALRLCELNGWGATVERAGERREP